MTSQAPTSGVEGYIDIHSAADHLGVKVSWLYEQCRLGRVPSFKLGSFRRFKRSDLDTWAAARREGPPPGQPDGNRPGR